MTDVTILLGADRRPSGSGILCRSGTVVTAAHVLRGRPAGQVNVRPAEHPAAVLPVQRVDHDPDLDVAVLTLTAAPPAPVRAADAAVDDRWVVTTRPDANDPQLSGRVVATNRVILNDGGTRVAMLQLDVDQPLGDFGGYSGSGVRLHSRPDTVIGMLCEQVHSRLHPVDGARRPAATVLYAVPIRTVSQRFPLALPDDPAHRHLSAARTHLRAGDPDSADRALAAVPGPARDAEYWWWRARTADARHNRSAASAYLDRALAVDRHHPASIAGKIRNLILTNDADDRTAARELAVAARGTDPRLDDWIRCLLERRLLDHGIRSATELATRCPYPDPDWS
jgi:hypothetical protein